MTTYKLSPVWVATQFFDNSGLPLDGGNIFTYQGGSFSTKQSTFSNSTGTANTNPIVLDSSGRIPVPMFIDTSLTYNLVLTKSDGTTILTSIDGVKS